MAVKHKAVSTKVVSTSRGAASRTKAATPWLVAALSYLPKWLAFQIERYRQPGCSVAIMCGSELVFESAFGVADVSANKPLTPRHRLRIASHSKSFTAAGIMRLRELEKLGLDDPIGRYVTGLHPMLAAARIGEVLSHGAGITRDGTDNGQFSDRRPYLSRADLRAELRLKPPFEPGVQLKYSNHGYGLLGLLIEEITGQTYSDWIMQNIVEPAGLKQTVPDWPLLRPGTPAARGHTAEFPFGERLVIPGDNVCDAIAPAAGFVSTAADVARYFAQLSPDQACRVLTPASRRLMITRRLRDTCNNLESHYGLGLMLSGPGPLEWFGHTGGFQGFVSRTANFPQLGFTISVLTNAQDGLSFDWVDGIAGILSAFARHGAPSNRLADWEGRLWNMWGAADLVATGKVLSQVSPAMTRPFDPNTTELAIHSKDLGIVQKTSAYNSPGQTVRRVRNKKGQVVELWIGGSLFVSRAAMIAETKARYARASKASPNPGQ